MSTDALQSGDACDKTTRRVQKRFAVPAGIVALLLLLMTWLSIRGEWADTEPQNPMTSSEGAITQLFLAPSGKVVRSAVVIDFPRDEVWKVVTDYERFSEIFPHVCHTNISRDPDGRFHLSGSAEASCFGTWPFDVHISHREGSDECVAEWDNPHLDLTVNRGSWTLTSLPDNRTLAVYTLAAEVRQFPGFVVRSGLLMRIDGVVAAVAREVAKRHALPR
ncbi:MAG: SRPBCC family protein [Planctomycetaceae bacterium]|jgi:uncharacterized membrane protein